MIGWVTAPIGMMVALVIVAMPLHALPFGSVDDQGHYHWFGLTSRDAGFVDGWARWNYSGYEGKAPRADGGGYHEYRAIVTAMDEVGQERGCGRAMWEYEPELERYGTPMALMLLPHWTDGCIGSMEGLYFEAAGSTPFHFLNQSELSVTPSRAQRDLRYGETDLDLGIRHLQLQGVRYYLAFSPEITGPAAEHPDLTEVAGSDPWTVYEIADAPLVEPLSNLPAVVEDLGNAQAEWLEPAQDWYLDPARWDVYLANDGPDEWPRIDQGDSPPAEPVPPADVSDIATDDDRIAFSVDRPGTPVVVKASYFPNWSVSGAEGPYRVAPNLMVVVPTDTEVELTFGRTGIDWFAILLSLLGLVGLVALARRPGVPVPERPEPVAPEVAEETDGRELDDEIAWGRADLDEEEAEEAVPVGVGSPSPADHEDPAPTP